MVAPVPYRSDTPEGMAREARAAAILRDAEATEAHAHRVIARNGRARVWYLAIAILVALCGLGLMFAVSRMPQKATESQVQMYGWYMVGSTVCFGVAYFLLAAYSHCRQNIETGQRLLLRAQGQRTRAEQTGHEHA
jgi:hypothetical protein